jgi:hypothetical protein
MNSTKLIRVKQRVGGNDRIFAYVMLNVRTTKHNYSETITVDVTPIVKDELIAGVPENDSIKKSDITDDKNNRFSATADVNSETITIAAGPRMHISSNIRNRGIGSFALNEIIKWMIVKYPNYMVQPIDISSSVTPDKEDLTRATAFFSNFGFRFKPSASSEIEGVMETALCMNLRQYTNRNKVDEIDIPKFIRELLRERYAIEEALKSQGRLVQEQRVTVEKSERTKFLSMVTNVLIFLGALFLLFYLK